MFRSIDSVLTHFDRYPDYEAYKLYKGKEAKDNKGGLIDESPAESDHGSALVRLRAVLQDMGPGQYLVQFKRKSTDNNNIINANFEIPYTNLTAERAAIGGTAQPMGINGRDYIHRDDLEKIVQAEIGKVNAQNELALMKREIEELKNRKPEKQEPLEKIMDNPLVQAIGAMFLQKMSAVPRGIAGGQTIVSDMPIAPPVQQHTPENTQHMSEQSNQSANEQKVNEIFRIGTLMTGNPDAGIDLLHKLAHYCYQNQNSPMFQIVRQQVETTVPGTLPE